MFPLDHKGRFIRLDDAPNDKLEVHRDVHHVPDLKGPSLKGRGAERNG